MPELQGFSDYKKEHYESSAFTTLETSGEESLFLRHGGTRLTGTLMRQSIYDLYLDTALGEMVVPKVEVKCHTSASTSETVAPLIKIDKKVAALALDTIHAPAHRYFIKNKTLYPLTQERQVMFLTLLEGEIIKGLVEDFSRYDVTMRLKGGIRLTVLRHAIYDMRDKRGRCYLKWFQNKAKDWKRSKLYT